MDQSSGNSLIKARGPKPWSFSFSYSLDSEWPLVEPERYNNFLWNLSELFLKGQIERKDIDFNIHLSSNPLGILPVMHSGAEVFKIIALVGGRIGCGSISGGQLGDIEQIEMRSPLTQQSCL